MASKWKDKRMLTKGKQGITLELEYDFTGLKDLKKRINELNNRHVKVGWISNKRHRGTGFYLAQLAYMQEFGSKNTVGNIPARPYFRQSFPDIWKVLKEDGSIVFQRMLNGQNYNDVLTQIGYKSKLAFHNSVMRQNMKQLSEFTVAKKGHTFQWDDTGEMLQGFEFKVFKSSLTKAERQQESIG